jgi:outer membrane protein assembly factor BamB
VPPVVICAFILDSSRLWAGSHTNDFDYTGPELIDESGEEGRGHDDNVIRAEKSMSVCVVKHLLTLVVLLSAAAPVSAEDIWPQFRGPDGQGHGSAHDLPTEWSESQNIAWKTAVPGLGHSSPAVGRGVAWLTYSLEEGKSLCVAAFDMKTGKLLSQREVMRTENPPPINGKNSHASPSSVLDGDRLYVHFGTSGTACISTLDGKTLWANQQLEVDHQEGPGSSPIVWKDLLIVHCDGRDVQYITALDKFTGKTVWKTERSGELPEKTDFRKAFCTPLVINVSGRPELISPAAHRVFAYDPATGKELWHVNYSPGFSNVPRPVFGNGLLYICTGYMKPQLWAIRPGGKGDVTKTNVVWKVTQHVPANPSPLLVGQELYLVSDAGIATCLDAQTGEELWRQRFGGTYWASPLYADGKIYFCSEEGDTTVIKPGREFKRLAKNRLDGGIMATPAILESSLLIRTRTHLYCVQDVKRPDAAVSRAD